jgi:hypothetical protein
MFYISDPIGHLTRIAQEMLNMETGRKLFENGRWIDRKQHMNYPMINSPDKKSVVRIKPSYGVLYLPVNADNYEKFANSLLKAIKREVDAHPLIKDLLGAYHTVNSSTFGFTNLRAKNKLQSTLVTGPTLSADYDESPGYLRVLRYETIFEHLPFMATFFRYSKFVWTILSIEELYQTIFTKSIPMDSQISLLFSIVYDSEGVMTWNDGTTWNEDLSLECFKPCGRISHTTKYGDLSNVRIEDIPKHHESGITDLLKNMRASRDYPGDIPTWTAFGCAITYNTIQRADIEIKRWLSPKWGELFFDSISSHFACHQLKPWRGSDILYKVEYADVNIINEIDGDLCRLCETPLYDDIYCIFPDAQSVDCYAYCPICIQMRLSTNMQQVNGEMVPINSYGTAIYYIQDHTKAQVTARTVHPRTAIEVIDMIPDAATGLDVHEYVSVLKSFYSDSVEPIIDRASPNDELPTNLGYIANGERVDEDGASVYILTNFHSRAQLFNKYAYMRALPDRIDVGEREHLLSKLIFVRIQEMPVIVQSY